MKILRSRHVALRFRDTRHKFLSSISRMLTDISQSSTLSTMKTAVAYLRTSSATNVGEDKDSLKRQQDAVRVYAQANDLDIVHEYYDAAVSGADPVEARPGFSEMLAYMMGNGARVVLVENASRFARDILVQLLGHELLKKHGISLIPVDAPAHFTEDTPTGTMLRTILGAVSQFEKEALVLKLRKARDRKRRDTGRCEGNPAFGVTPPEHIRTAKAAAAHGLTLRAIAQLLDAAGFRNRAGKVYGAGSVDAMLHKA
jgi:DNA invertase Pin-like site-specific DNA recombinase